MKIIYKLIIWGEDRPLASGSSVYKTAAEIDMDESTKATLAKVEVPMDDCIDGVKSVYLPLCDITVTDMFLRGWGTQLMGCRNGLAIRHSLAALRKINST